MIKIKASPEQSHIRIYIRIQNKLKNLTSNIKIIKLRFFLDGHSSTTPIPHLNNGERKKERERRERGREPILIEDLDQ